jgi:competence protein ComFC
LTALSGRLKYRLHHYLWRSLDWLFPPQCAGCGTPNIRWCIDCTRNSQRIGPPYCPVCGRHGEFAVVCDICRADTPSFTGLRSWAVYGDGIRSAILRLKYSRDIALGEVLSSLLVRLFLKQDWQVDLVIPVPLSLDRIDERGYNQASLLALPFAFGLNLDYSERVLVRERDTRSQVGLSAAERRQNVWGAFRTTELSVSGRQILVIDDVTTTGSTLDACARTLLDAGAHCVYCLTLARSG